MRGPNWVLPQLFAYLGGDSLEVGQLGLCLLKLKQLSGLLQAQLVSLAGDRQTTGWCHYPSG